MSNIKRLHSEKLEHRQEFDTVVTGLEEKQVDNAITLFVGEGMHKGYTDEVHGFSQYASAKNITKVVTSILLQYREDSRVMIAHSKYVQ